VSEEEEKKGEESAEAAIARTQANAQAYLLGAFEAIQTEVRRSKFTNVLAHTPSFGRGESNVGLISRMANPPIIQNFIDANPAQLSALTPRLEFFFVENVNGVLEETPFNFSDHVSGKRMIEMGKKLYGGNLEIRNGKTILDASTAGSQVGVKEFSWMFDNKHQGDKTLKASVDLVFSSAQELLSQQFLRFIFNVNNEDELVKSQTDKTAAFNDIIARFNTMKEKTIQDVGALKKADDKKSFKQLKIKVGWSMPQRINEEVFFAGMNVNQIRDFKASVAATQKTILLNFTKYKLEFGQQGQVNLNIEYVGSLDSLLSDPEAADIFERVRTEPKSQITIVPRAISLEKGWANWATFGYLSDKNKAKDGKVGDKAFGYKADDSTPINLGTGEFGPNDKQMVGFIAKQLHKAAVTDGFTLSPGFKISLDAVDYEEKTLLMARQYLIEQNGQNGDKYAKQLEKIENGIESCRLVRSMIDSRMNTRRHSQFMMQLLDSGRLRYVTVEPSVLQSTKPETAMSSGGSVNVKVGKLGQGVTAIGQRQAAFRDAMTNKRRKDAGLDPVDTKFALDPKNVFVDSKTEASKVVFFTVGDLIDIANSDINGKRQTLLELVDGNLIFGAFSGYSAGLTTNKDANFSIADIPINVEWFGQWFIDNYTGGNPPPQRISLRSFINKLLSNLVAPLLNQALETPNKKVSINFSMTTLTYPKVPGTDLKKASVGGRLGRGQISEASKAATQNKAMAKSGPTRTFFVVFATIKDKGKLTGDPKKDRESGIFHVALGSDRGIVKSFTFSEKKMPQLRAMHIENNNMGSALILPQDVELTMVGNTFFRNGSIIYVDAGFALGNEVAKKLGIGGYYMVVKSENTISSSTFETRLTCMFLQRPGEL
jgi:hypothetical protein